MNLRKEKKEAKKLKDRRIEIDGRVWYIPLPGLPGYVKRAVIASKRGKRRAKGKTCAPAGKMLVFCKRSPPPKRKLTVWNPKLCQVFTLSVLDPAFELTVQPRFKPIRLVPVLMPFGDANITSRIAREVDADWAAQLKKIVETS